MPAREEAWSSDALLLRGDISASSLFGVLLPLNVMVLFCLQEISTVLISLCLNYSFSDFLHIWLLYCFNAVFSIKQFYAVQQK